MSGPDRPRQPSPYRQRGDNIPLNNVNPGYQEGIFYYDDGHPGYSEAGPSIPLEHHGSDIPGSYSEGAEEGLRQRPQSSKQWVKEDTPRDAAILLESLPSKQFEKMASEVASGSSWKKRTKRKSYHGTIHIPRGKDVTDELMKTYDDNPDMMDDVDIKEMNMTLSSKRKLRSQMSLRRKHPSRWKQTKYSFAIAWKHFKYNIAEVAYFFKLWKGHLKKIEGHFGTGVLSYFLFLKWLFYINIPVFVFTFGFVILPQVLYRYLVQTPCCYTQNVTFTGKELLTGSGWFSDTEMYYGYYTSETFHINQGAYYNMKYAYLFTCGGYYILCMIILAVSISKSYKKNYIEGSDAFDFYYVSRVFCGWDYGITNKDAAKLKSMSIYHELKEYLSGITVDEEEKELSYKCKWFFLRLLTNLLILGMIGGSGYLVFWLSDELQNFQGEEIASDILREMAMPLCVSGVNLVLPFIFSLIARIESYEKPKTELYINMVRTMLLKAVTLGVLVYFWYQKLDVECRETFIGQEIYRLVVVDFVFILLTTFLFEFIRRLLKDYCCKSWSHPEFDIGRNTLNLIYSQALCWLGTYFCPMLSLIMIIKLFIIFYVKRVSVIQNCQPSLRPWRAARAHTIFLAFLFCFFILATAAVACAVIFVRPSATCGPFSDYSTAYSVVIELVDSWKEKYNWLHTIVKIIASSGFIAGTLVVLLVLTYYMRIVMVGHKEMVTLLRQQLAMEGRDKAYLLKMLQDASKKHSRAKAASSSNLVAVGSEASSTLNSLSPGGRQFIKTRTAEKTGTEISTPSRGRRRKENGHGAASP